MRVVSITVDWSEPKHDPMEKSRRQGADGSKEA